MKKEVSSKKRKSIAGSKVDHSVKKMKQPQLSFFTKVTDKSAKRKSEDDLNPKNSKTICIDLCENSVEEIFSTNPMEENSAHSDVGVLNENNSNETKSVPTEAVNEVSNKDNEKEVKSGVEIESDKENKNSISTSKDGTSGVDTSNSSTSQTSTPKCSKSETSIPKSSTSEKGTPKSSTSKSKTPFSTSEKGTPKSSTSGSKTPFSTSKKGTPKSSTSGSKTPFSTSEKGTPKSSTSGSKTPFSTSETKTTKSTREPRTPKITNEPKTPKSTNDAKTPKSSTSGGSTPKSSTSGIKTPSSSKFSKAEKEEIRLEKQNEKEKKKLELQEQKEQKLKEKQEIALAKQKKKDEEKLKREQEKLEKDKKKEEEKRQKEQEKMEKDKKREEEKNKKEEEKKKKDEEKRLKDEEKLQKKLEKQKEEEDKKMAEQEEKEKKMKEKQKFAQFFVCRKGDEEKVPSIESKAHSKFMTFCVKGNMELAPLQRTQLTEDKKEFLDSNLNNSIAKYLLDIKNDDYRMGKSIKTLPEKVVDNDVDLEIIDDDDDEDIEDIGIVMQDKEHEYSKIRAKLLQFCENKRPAYFGTFKKKSERVSGRRPFYKDENFFDYEYESDDDWEEEEAGESLSDNEEIENEEPDDQYEFDDFLLPHGYLSDDEGQDENIVEDYNEEPEKENDHEKKKEEMLRMKQEEFEEELKKKTKQLKPKVFGCVWIDDVNSHRAYEKLVKIFTPYAAQSLIKTFPIPTTIAGDQSLLPVSEDTKANKDDSDKSTVSRKMSKVLPENDIPDLIRLIHGNCNGKNFLANEFTEHLKKKNSNTEPNATPGVDTVSKKMIKMKIRELGTYGKNNEEGQKYNAWHVSKDIRDLYNLSKLTINLWEYTLTPKLFPPEPKSINSKDETKEVTPKLKPKSLITKFTKILSENEKAELAKVSTPSHKDTVKSATSTPSSVDVSKSKTPSSTSAKKNVNEFQKPKCSKTISQFFVKKTDDALMDDDIMIID